MADDLTARGSELAANLAAVQARIAAACRTSGRRRSELVLIAVSKTWPIGDVAALRRLGVNDFGENRDQEAAEKAAAEPDARWHFIGQLQTRKARSVATYADVVHSVDRTKLAAALSAGAQLAGREVDVLVQVGLSGSPERGGAAPERVPELADLVAGLTGLRLAGVMALAPLGVDPGEAFARLRAVAERVATDHPGADVISAGMSGDLEAAVAAGATHLRVGTAVFGHRPTVLG